MLESIVGVGLCLLGMFPPPAGESRPVPAADGEVRTGAEQAAWDAAKAQRPGPVTFVDVYPEASAAFEGMQARTERLSERFPVHQPIDAAGARELVDELYHDTGSAKLNYRWQSTVLDYIRDYAVRPETGGEARSVLREGLFDYEAAGGARDVSPLLAMRLARAFAACADRDHPECEAKAAELSAHARQWADALDNPHFQRHVQRQTERIEDTKDALVRQGRLEALPGGVSVEGLRAAIDDLVKSERVAVERLAAVTRAVLNVPLSAPVERDELIARLLIAYRRLLERPSLAKETVRAIDSRLHTMARGKDRALATAEHWRLWTDAVTALGRRASRDLRRFVHEAKERMEDPVAREALSRAWRGI